MSEDPYKIEDPSILTYIEHKLIGSSIDREDMIANPRVPMAVLDGRRPIDVADERLKMGEIKSMDAESFGMKVGKLPIIAIGEMSTRSGEIIGQLRVTGVFDFLTEEIDRNPKIISEIKLTSEGREKYMVKDEVSRGEKIG